MTRKRGGMEDLFDDWGSEWYISKKKKKKREKQKKKTKGGGKESAHHLKKQGKNSRKDAFALLEEMWDGTFGGGVRSVL